MNKTQSLLQGVLVRKKGMQTIMKQCDAITRTGTTYSRAKVGCDQLFGVKSGYPSRRAVETKNRGVTKSQSSHQWPGWRTIFRTEHIRSH